jgi:hypothetical protein
MSIGLKDIIIFVNVEKVLFKKNSKNGFNADKKHEFREK